MWDESNIELVYELKGGDLEHEVLVEMDLHIKLRPKCISLNIFQEQSLTTIKKPFL